MQPMFVMTDDGGMVPEDASSSAYAHALLQRAFVYDLLSQGLSMTSLSDLEFRDSKVSSTLFAELALSNRSVQ